MMPIPHLGIRRFSPNFGVERREIAAGNAAPHIQCDFGVRKPVLNACVALEIRLNASCGNACNPADLMEVLPYP